MIPEFYLTETVCQRFGANPSKYAAYGLKGHEGEDYGRWKVYPVLLDTYRKVFPFIADGTIIVAGDIGKNYGLQYTVQSDNGDRWIYGHCSKLFRTVGERVSAGENAGVTGQSGRTTIDHLHLGWLPAGESVNNGYMGCRDPRIYINNNLKEVKMEMPYKAGDEIKTSTGRNTLGYRREPGINSELLAVSGLETAGRLKDGTILKVIGNAAQADGYLWIDVDIRTSFPGESNFPTGWIAIKKNDGASYTVLHRSIDTILSGNARNLLNEIKAKIEQLDKLI